jgi:signal peptidase I
MLEKAKKVYHFSTTWTGTLVVVLLAIFFLAQAFVIPSGSMKRTYLIGDFLLVKKFTYGITIPHIPMLEIPLFPDLFDNGHLIEGDRPKRGDVTVFRYPHNPKIHYVKRCVALGGDKLMLRDKDLYLRPHEGDEYIKNTYLPGLLAVINGELWVKNPYFYENPKAQHDDRITREQHAMYSPELFDFGPILIPKDEFFMMGDNREHSGDSRSWGSVAYKYIVGTPWITYLSWESRSYNDVTRGGEHNSPDHQDVSLVCHDIDNLSDTCEDRWEKNRYKIRWDRMFKNSEELGNL